MTYKPGTGRIRCDLCGSKQRDRVYYDYRLIYKNRVVHVCSDCIEHGAYWCAACDDIHAGPYLCSMQRLPLDV